VQGFDGETVLRAPFERTVAPRSCQAVAALSELAPSGFNASTQFLAVRSREARTVFFGDIDKNLPYPEPNFEAELQSDGNTHRLTITAHTLLRDLCIFAERHGFGRNCQ
jgi:beta-mannosidase